MDGVKNKIDFIRNYTLFILPTEDYTHRFKLKNSGESLYCERLLGWNSWMQLKNVMKNLRRITDHFTGKKNAMENLRRITDHFTGIYRLWPI